MPSKKLDTSGLVTAIAMLALSGWVLWESEGYSELAAAFPRTVALIMAAASAVLILRCLLRLQRPAEVEAGSWLHRGALLLVLVGWAALIPVVGFFRSEEHTSALQSLMRISYAVFCLKKKNCVMTLFDAFLGFHKTLISEYPRNHSSALQS